jgi:methanol metabolism-related c-type cytochrome
LSFPSRASLAFAVVLVAVPGFLAAAPNEASKAVRSDEGKYFDANDVPTYNIKDDGTVDWYAFSGYRRFHAECHVCHGPDGLGSTYAPSLVESMRRLDYSQFMDVVVNGRKNVGAGAGKESVMPALGENKNVMCYIDDLYVYLRARADGALDRGRPAKREDKPASVTESEKSCMSG